MTYRNAALLLVLLLAGCGHAGGPEASLEASDYQSVRVSTPGVDGSSCALQTSAGSYLVTAPAMVRVVRTAQPMSVFCTKGEHFKGSASVASRRIEDVYSFPENISVPMRMNGDSLRADVKIF